MSLLTIGKIAVVTSSDFEAREIVSRSIKNKHMKTYYVYILECSENTYYTGITSNLTKRIIEHKSGKHTDSYTYKRRLIALKFYAEFTNVELAIQTEKQIIYTEMLKGNTEISKV